jgi:hypothetical protein
VAVTEVYDRVIRGSVFSKNFVSGYKRGGPAKKSQYSQRGDTTPYQTFVASKQAIPIKDAIDNSRSPGDLAMHERKG